MIQISVLNVHFSAFFIRKKVQKQMEINTDSCASKAKTCIQKDLAVDWKKGLMYDE